MQLQLYNDLKKWITDRLPDIKSVGLYNNQFQRENVEHPFLYPVVFISFPEVNYTNLSHFVQSCEIKITLYLGFESYKDEDTYILQMKQDLYKCVCKFVSPDFSYPKRISEKENFDHNNINIYETDYMIKGNDFTADDRWFKTITATPVTIISITQSAI